MAKDNRVTKNTRHSYATRSNLIKKVKTPGGHHTVQILVKKSKGAMCSECKIALPGIKHLKSSAYHTLKKRERTVSRAYGGNMCAGCVKARIVRAFLIEEQKIVKRMLSEKAKASKK